MGFKTIKREDIYDGKIFKLVRDTIELPNGKKTCADLVIHNGASAILPITSDGRIILARQFRYAAGEEVLEIPAGRLEKDEDPLECAKRELEEETGFKSNDITFMFKMYSAIGFCTEMLYVYYANNLEEGQTNFDENEFIDVEYYSVDEAVDMIFNNVIKDSKTISAILAYRELKK